MPGSWFVVIYWKQRDITEVKVMNVGQVASSAIANDASVGDAVNIAVLKKAMDVAQIQGATTVKMMEQSLAPHLGGNIDIRI